MKWDVDKFTQKERDERKKRRIIIHTNDLLSEALSIFSTVVIKETVEFRETSRNIFTTICAVNESEVKLWQKLRHEFLSLFAFQRDSKRQRFSNWPFRIFFLLLPIWPTMTFINWTFFHYFPSINCNMNRKLELNATQKKLTIRQRHILMMSGISYNLSLFLKSNSFFRLEFYLGGNWCEILRGLKIGRNSIIYFLCVFYSIHLSLEEKGWIFFEENFLV